MLGFTRSDEAITDSIIGDVETLLGITYPAAYRQIIRDFSGAYGDAALRPNSASPGSSYVGIGFILSLLPSSPHSVSSVLSSWSDHGLLDRVIPFAEDYHGAYVCFDYRASNTPQVVSYLPWLHGDDGILKVCDTFDEFLEHLELSDNHLFFGSRRLDYRTAVRADTSKQNYSVCARPWYVDATFICRDCGEEFTFTANEQRFWYEEKQFWIDSLPIRCLACRKEQRTLLALRKRYDALIATALGACPLETKEEVVAIINELEVAQDSIPEKMKQNRRMLYAQLAKRA